MWGGGTGKLTENLLELGVKNIIAIEPNDAMRKEGMKYIKSNKVTWQKGQAERTGLAKDSVDWVVMGSAFHWTDVSRTLREFGRILKNKGYFTALWNPRDIERYPLHKKIEIAIYNIIPNIKRISSGSSEFTENMFEKLISTGDFTDIIYIEARHEEVMLKERYMGIWKSVSDIQFQAGKKWNQILEEIESIIKRCDKITVPYKTKAWTARKK